MPKSDNDVATHHALLAAATALFAEQGYRDTGVRQIAAKAKANIAAVNYHFGGKQALYQAVLRSQAEQKFSRYPLLSAEDLKKPPEDKLQAIIHALFQRLFDDSTASYAPRLIMRELMDPTDAIDFLVRELVGPQFSQLREVVSEILGPSPEDTLNRACFSVLGQCLFYKLAQPLASRFAPELFHPQSTSDTARHVSLFSLQGLTTCRTAMEPSS